MGATLSSADAILKEMYLGPLREEINTETLLLNRLVKNSKDIVGREAWIPVRMANTHASGPRTEGAILPVAQNSTFKELKVPLNWYFGALRVGGEVMEQTQKGDQGSFLRIVDAEAKGLRDEMKLNLAHDFYMGHTLAVCGVTVAANVIVLNAASNMNYFDIGMVVDIVDAATGLVFAAQARTITAIAGTTITVSGAVVTTAVTDIVVRTNSYGAAVTSLMDIADDTADIHGVTTASYRNWRGTVKTGVPALALSAIQNFLDSIVVFSGKYPSALVSGFDVSNYYFNLLQANRQFISNQPVMKSLSGGHRELEYASLGGPVAWLTDRLAPNQTLLALKEDDLQVFTPGDFDFVDVKGSVWHPEILGDSATFTYKAILHRAMELGCLQRNSQGKWTGITS